jgi:uncharacterized phage-associated protein
MSAEDVAVYILEKRRSMSAMKLQKLVYYAQAWSLVWDEKPLFDDQIQAWLAGPVVPALYAKHRGLFTVDKSVFREGDSSKLGDVERETVDAVLDFYGDRPAEWLSDLTHKERPWRDARVGVGDMENSENVIPLESMAVYYTRVAEVAKLKPAKER